MAHTYLIAAFCCTWAIQLGYLLLVAIQWQGQRGKLKAGMRNDR
jgi:hypothetical protein